MWLSFSKYSTYLGCPRQYKYQVDRVTPPAPESKYFALYGILIQKFFEDYTNTLLPKNIVINENTVRNVLEKRWQELLKKEYVNWNDPWVRETPSQIFEEAFSDILENIATFDFWPNTRSEVTYKINLRNSGDVLNGRIDFIRTLPEGGVELLDGKSTKHLDRVDPEQLLFYALMFFLRHKQLPKRLGFLFYRYKIIKYIDFNKDILIAFKNKLALAKKAIKLDRAFEAKVLLSKRCQWCSYKLLCKPYMEKKAANAEKRSKIKIDFEGDVLQIGLGS